MARRRAATREEILTAAWEVTREKGLVELTLRDVAERVGMRAPSLYSHFPSKHAIYDAMFGQAWAAYETVALEAEATVPAHPRAAVRYLARTFVEFACADLPRYQLMNQQIIPGFVPSAESYAPAVRVLDRARDLHYRLGSASEDDFRLLIAMVAGLVNQHFANDPGGERYASLLNRAIDMWADAVGLPPEHKL